MASDIGRGADCSLGRYVFSSGHQSARFALECRSPRWQPRAASSNGLCLAVASCFLDCPEKRQRHHAADLPRARPVGEKSHCGTHGPAATLLGQHCICIGQNARLAVATQVWWTHWCHQSTQHTPVDVMQSKVSSMKVVHANARQRSHINHTAPVG